MDLYDVMRTTFAAREFTDDPVPDAALHRILENDLEEIEQVFLEFDFSKGK